MAQALYRLSSAAGKVVESSTTTASMCGSCAAIHELLDPPNNISECSVGRTESPAGIRVLHQDPFQGKGCIATEVIAQANKF